MSDDATPQPGDVPGDGADSSPGGDGSGHGPQSQEIRHSQVSALVPEHVARGIFSTGAVVVQGQHEFIVDFLLRMTSPQQLAARIVLPPAVVSRFIAALKENIGNYEQRFGPLPPAAAPSAPAQQTSAEELYEQLKLADDILSGTYANAVMIGHTATEFCFDFITTFFPRSAVACRVYLAAPNAVRLLESLSHSFDQYQQKIARQQKTDPPQEQG